MDSIFTSWLKIAGLLLAACMQLGCLYISFRLLKQCKAKAEDLLEDQEKADHKPKPDTYSNKDLFPKEKTTVYKDYNPGGYMRQSDARVVPPYIPSPKGKTWVAELIIPTGKQTPVYYFHCPANDVTTPAASKCYLYTGAGKGFVTTDNPATAILLQQLLNDGNLTVKPFTTNETNQ
jgi:hypothetical protein